MRATFWLGDWKICDCAEVPEVVARELALTGSVTGSVTVTSERLVYQGLVTVSEGYDPPLHPETDDAACRS